MRNRKHYILVALLVVVSTVVLYFVLSAISQLPTAASAQAGPIDVMFNVHFAFISFFFALIMVFILYSAFVFRRQPGDDEDGPHIHGHTGLEILWTVIPIFIVVAFGIYGAVVLNDITGPKENEMVVNVQAQQWSWSFEYPEYDNLASGELVLPVDQPILLEMESRDVIHSFWVPEFRVKQDVLPDVSRQLRVTPTEAGNYKVRCAEICGLQHAGMLADVRVLPPEEFEAWVEERLQQPAFAELTPAERGEIWYQEFACDSCHTHDGSPGAGPTWLGLFGREEQLADGSTVTVDEEYLHDSILNPNAQIVAGFNPGVMPQDYEERFAEREAQIMENEGIEIDIVADLIAFIETLEEE
jgi:cytochrome c oxidase subunit 2